MTVTFYHAITDLLTAWRGGDQEAMALLISHVYDELHRMARGHVRLGHPDQTLQATALVHETYLRLMKIQGLEIRDRAHFFAIGSQIMRRILVDHARVTRSQKRGGYSNKVPLDEIPEPSCGSVPDLIDMDEALRGLSEFDPRKGRIVELRVFGGLNIPETAEILNISTATVINDYRFARAWLLRKMRKRGLQRTDDSCGE